MMFTPALTLDEEPVWQADPIQIDVGCTFEFETTRETHAVVMVEPHFAEVGRVAEARFEIDPPSPSHVYLDSFGNSCRRLDLAAGNVTLTFAAELSAANDPDPAEHFAVELQPAELSDEALMFVLPSRFCESDQMVDFAFSQFGNVSPGWSRVQAINDWVHDSIHFQYGNSSPSLSAVGVFESRTGVCRDFTHLAITLCRALNIPARYVFGYLPDIGVPDPGTPMDFCAWMEVFLGGDWHTFDPRNNERRIGRTVIGRGRDAADVAMVTSFGTVALKSMVVVAEQKPEAP
jgi:transglutaminase-like putative cysteine protease